MRIDLKISSAFVESRTSLTWREVEFGLQNGWLTNQTVISLAIDRVTAGDESSDVFALAAVLPDEGYEFATTLRRLADRDCDLSHGKWLFILMAWLFENRETVRDPLGVVEELYADFDYPNEIADVVRYMPAADPSRVGESFLIDAWRRYLIAAGDKYAPAPTKNEKS